MNVLDAIEAVLAEASEPLSYREIARRVLERDLWRTKGFTPEATVNARLAVNIKTFGAASRFQRTAAGVFALRCWGLPEVAARGARSEPPQAMADEESSAEPPPPTHQPAAFLSFTDAAETVLEQSGRQQPMHYRAITERVLALGLVNTRGLTPEASLYAQVLTETRRKTRRGEQPRFVLYGKGMIGLATWVTGGLAYQIEQHNEEVRRKLRDQLLAMPPAEFEALIVELLAALGFDEVSMTPASGDGGIDVRGTLVVGEVIRTRMAVQVKRWRRNVQAPTVQQVRGSLGIHEQGLIVTTSDFSRGACKEAERPNAVPVALMNGEQLVRLLVENDIGVHRMSYELIELGEGE